MKELAPGCTLRESGAWTVLKIEHTAAAKYRDSAYVENLRLKLGEQRYRREILCDWTVAAGEPFFIEVAKNPDIYLYQPAYLLDAPIHVGLDFGQRFPAACWLQYDDVWDRVFVLREWMPPVLTAAHTFRDVVLWLSGLKPMEKLIAEAQKWAAHMASEPSFPKVPWFGSAPQMRYQWWTGHEAAISRAEVAADSQERSTAEIWESDGISLSPHVVGVEARELAIRKLVLMREDGWPGLMLSPVGCPLLIEAMKGGLTFAGASKANPMPDRSARDGWYEHLIDALGYAVISVAGTRRIGKLPTQPREMARPMRTSPYDRITEKPRTPGFQWSSAWERFRKRY